MSSPTTPSEADGDLREKLGIKLANFGVELLALNEKYGEVVSSKSESEELALNGLYIDSLVDFFHAELEGRGKVYVNTLAQAQLNMRPLIALKNGNGEHDGNWYVMYWDDKDQVWNRARYADIVNEAKVQLSHKEGEEKNVP